MNKRYSFQNTVYKFTNWKKRKKGKKMSSESTANGVRVTKIRRIESNQKILT